MSDETSDERRGHHFSARSWEFATPSQAQEPAPRPGELELSFARHLAISSTGARSFAQIAQRRGGSGRRLRAPLGRATLARNKTRRRLTLQSASLASSSLCALPGDRQMIFDVAVF